MLRLAVLMVFLLASTILTDALKTRPCSNGQPHPSLVMIDDCCEMPCRRVRGTDKHIMIEFDAPFNSQTLRYERIVTSLGVTAPFPLPEEVENACDWLSGSSCPINQGQKITATLTYLSLPIYPLLSYTQQLSVIDEEGRTVTCFEYDAQMVHE